MTIPRRYLITVEMGHESVIGSKMLKAKVDVTAKKHCYLCVYAMADRRNPDSYYQPYYSASFMPALLLMSYVPVPTNVAGLCACVRVLIRHSADIVSQHAYFLVGGGVGLAAGLLHLAASEGSQDQHQR